MKELAIIRGYLHLSFGNYSQPMFFGANELTTCTGIVTDGDLHDGVVVVGVMLMNWGIALGVSWTGGFDG